MGWESQVKTPIVGYCRISKDRKGHELGVDRQKHEILEFAKQRGWTIVDWYVDNDMSAYRRRRPRPGYTRLLEDMEAGRVGSVMAWHTDRLHRSTLELDLWIRIADPRGIAVITKQAGEIDLATPGGRMHARNLANYAQYESEIKSERLADKMKELARDGKWRGGPRPFGYTADGMHLEVAEADMIKSGVRTILQGGSLVSVCRAWTAAGGRRTASGKPFVPNLVSQVLTRPRNAGLMVARGEVVGKGNWPAIITVEELQAVTQILKDPGRRTNAGTQPRWLGTNLYLCGLEGCGHTMIVGAVGTGKLKNGGHRKPTYTCGAGRRGQGVRIEGRHVARQADALDRFIGTLLVDKMSERGFQELLRPHDTIDIDVAALREELALIETRQKELAGMLRQGWTMEMVTEANNGMAARTREIESALQSTMSTSAASQMASEPDVERAWCEASLETKRAVLRELATVTVQPAPPGQRRFDPDNVDVSWRV